VGTLAPAPSRTRTRNSCSWLPNGSPSACTCGCMSRSGG
jgi:hypothetical protein